MNIPEEFNDIRPYTPEELPAIFEELLADPAFRVALGKVLPQYSLEEKAARMRSCKTNLEFQKAFCYPFLQQLVSELSDGLTMDATSLDKATPYTFVSNHRDIILDSALLCILLVDNGMNTVEIAIGDNLLIYPWIKKLVRVNKSFIVQRALTMRQMLQSSARMSRYMHFAIAEKRESIWIAQREGRAKNSDDRTQESILKMMTMGGEGETIDRLLQLNIVPTAISYEYDPCDFLKAQEFQAKRDDPEFKKSQEDDLKNMFTGLFGYKGRIHFAAAPCINAALSNIDASLPKQELYEQIAALIDKGIHQNYRLYPINYVAYDLLKDSDAFAAHYTAEEKAKVMNYLEGQLAKIVIPNRDDAYLRERMLEMYANPLVNNLAACE